MANKRIKVSYGRTCQSAPYESIRLDVSIEQDMNEDQVTKVELDKMVHNLRQYVKLKIRETLDNE